MKLYVRKLNSQQCTNKSISVTMPIFKDFFEDSDVIYVKGKKSGHSGKAPFTFTRDREDPRFGGVFKEVLRAEGNGSFKIGDILTVEKAKPNYIVSLITEVDPEYETFDALLKNSIHSEIHTDTNLDNNASTENYKDIFNHSVYGIHIKMRNDALSEDRPHICIGWSAMGNLSDVATKDDLAVMHDAVWPDSKSRAKGQNVGQIWRFIKEMNIGDYVVFAEDDVCHIGQVTSDYYYDETSYPNQSEDYTNVRNVKWLKTNIKRSELSKSFHYSLRTAMSVWGLNDYKSAIYELLNDTYIKDEVVEADDTEITAEEENIKKILPVLPKRTRKAFELNSILYGAPGTGKTYATAKYALAITEGKSLEEYNDVTREDIMSKYNQLVKDGLVVFTTFHQNYGYEDFIQGIRPDTSTQEMRFKTVDGVFKKIAETAMNVPEKDFVIIIDEINRANISKVFGELITLIEDDKRWGEENAVSATLPSGEIFAVPNNLYIVGTMNSADKSISLIDTALRRRFDFVEFVPDLTLISDTKLKAVLKKLNEGIEKELNSTDLLVGHSYFINKSADDICTIMNRNIIPLLYEYFFDNKNKVEAQLKSALEDLDVEIISNTMGRIKIKKKEV